MIRNLTMLTKSILRINMARYHRDGDELPRQYNFKWTKEQRELLFPKRKLPVLQADYNDPLHLPGNDQGEILSLFEQFMTLKNMPISPQNVAMLIYLFIEKGYMNKQAFDRLQSHAYRYRGQYKLRSVFGGLFGAIMYNRKKLISFFMEEYQASERKFTPSEILEIVEALNENHEWTIKQKQQFWEEHFKYDFKDALKQINLQEQRPIRELYDAFIALQEYDQQLWNIIIGYLGGKTGWLRVQFMEKLYTISGTFQKAKEAFQIYYEELSKEDQILRRYNFGEMRYYTPRELIEIADANGDNYFPKNYTIVPQDQDPVEWNKIYQEWLLKGSIKQEEQIIRDKSQSFGYAIKDRYQSMKEDNIDLSSLTKQQFTELFGSYEIAKQFMENKEHQKEQKQLEQGQEGQDQQQQK